MAVQLQQQQQQQQPAHARHPSGSVFDDLHDDSRLAEAYEEPDIVLDCLYRLEWAQRVIDRIGSQVDHPATVVFKKEIARLEFIFTTLVQCVKQSPALTRIWELIKEGTAETASYYQKNWAVKILKHSAYEEAVSSCVQEIEACLEQLNRELKANVVDGILRIPISDPPLRNFWWMHYRDARWIRTTRFMEDFILHFGDDFLEDPVVKVGMSEGNKELQGLFRELQSEPNLVSVEHVGKFFCKGVLPSVQSWLEAKARVTAEEASQLQRVIASHFVPRAAPPAGPDGPAPAPQPSEVAVSAMLLDSMRSMEKWAGEPHLVPFLRDEAVLRAIGAFLSNANRRLQISAARVIGALARTEPALQEPLGAWVADLAALLKLDDAKARAAALDALGSLARHHSRNCRRVAERSTLALLRHLCGERAAGGGEEAAGREAAGEEERAAGLKLAGYLCEHAPLQAAILEAGLLPTLALALRSDRPATRGRAAVALHRLAAGEARVAAAIVKQGVVPRLVELLALDGAQEAVAQLQLGTLVRLARTGVVKPEEWEHLIHRPTAELLVGMVRRWSRPSEPPAAGEGEAGEAGKGAGEGAKAVHGAAEETSAAALQLACVLVWGEDPCERAARRAAQSTFDSLVEGLNSIVEPLFAGSRPGRRAVEPARGALMARLVAAGLVEAIVQLLDATLAKLVAYESRLEEDKNRRALDAFARSRRLADSLLRPSPSRSPYSSTPAISGGACTPLHPTPSSASLASASASSVRAPSAALPAAAAGLGGSRGPAVMVTSPRRSPLESGSGASEADSSSIANSRYPSSDNIPALAAATAPALAVAGLAPGAGGAGGSPHAAGEELSPEMFVKLLTVHAFTDPDARPLAPAAETALRYGVYALEALARAAAAGAGGRAGPGEGGLGAAGVERLLASGAYEALDALRESGMISYTLVAVMDNVLIPLAALRARLPPGPAALKPPVPAVRPSTPSMRAIPVGSPASPAPPRTPAPKAA